MRIQVNTRALASYGMTLETLRTAIAAANANEAKGSFDGPTRAYAINANDQLVDAADYANQIIAYKNGAPVRLKDVATVVQAPENTRLGACYDVAATSRRRPPVGIVLNVQRQPGANVITTVDKIKKALPDLTVRPAGRASTSPWSPTAPPASAPRSATSSSSWCWPSSWWWR